MNKITNFKDLYAWQEGHKLVLLTYKITESFPQREMFGLTNQMRRAAVSITSNIAEGFSRRSYKDKAQFYSMALGSLTELQNQVLVAKDIGYLTLPSFDKTSEQTIIVSKLINGLIKKSKTYS